MYRKRNGSLGMSFTRLMTNTFPNFHNDTPEQDAEIPPRRKDMLYVHQLASSNPLVLDELSFYTVGTTTNEPFSRKIHKALLKNGVLNADGVIDTYKIGPKFAHQLACISLVAQRNLVGVLFWWEEEVQRLKKLGAEEEELSGLIEALDGPEGGDREEVDRLKFARERVRMKRRQLPSQRDVAIEEDRDDIAMAWHGRRMSEPKPAVGELPPAYSKG